MTLLMRPFMNGKGLFDEPFSLLHARPYIPRASSLLLEISG